MIKQLLVLTIVFSIALTFILVPIRYEYEQIAPLQYSNYNIFVNGRITKSDYLQLIQEPNIVNSAVASYGDGNVYKRTLNDTYIETLIPVDTLTLSHETLKDSSKLDIIGLNKFLISGELKSGYPDSGYAAISWSIAKRLGVNIGDTVILRVGNGKLEYKVSGITDPTTETEFVMEDTPDWEDAGNLYIKSENQKATLEYIKSYIAENGKDWALRTIEEQKNSASINVKESLPPFLRFGLVIGSLLIYLIILLREQNIVIDNKKRNFSILTALGATKIELMHIYSIEQIFVMVAVTFLAALVSKFVIYQNLFTLYMPISVLVHGVVIGLTLNIIAVIVALFYTKRKLNKVPVAELLRQEY